MPRPLPCLWLLPLAAALSACSVTLPSSGGGSALPPTQTQPVSGYIETPAGTSLQAVSSQAVNWNAPHVPGVVLVQGGSLTPARASSALAGFSAQLALKGVFSVRVPAGQRARNLAAELAKRGLQVQPDYVYSPQAFTPPNDPGYPGPGNPGIDIGSSSYYQSYLTEIGAAGAWQALSKAGLSQDYLNNPVITAVLDTGVNTFASDLARRLLPGENFCEYGSQGCTTPSTTAQLDDVQDTPASQASDGGHGTDTTGIIAADGNNNLGITGMTWGGQDLLPVKVFGEDCSQSPCTMSATTTSVAKGLNYAVQRGAKVVNMSLGIAGITSDPTLDPVIQSAYNKGVVLIAAAGNDGSGGVEYPADNPYVLSVGAVTSGNQLSCFSAIPAVIGGQAQANVNLVAPGGDAPGDAISQTSCASDSNPDPEDILSLAYLHSGDTADYNLWAGTSESAPQVAGTVAMMLAADPNLSPYQVAEILTETATVIPGKSNQPGYGAGLLNAAAAVQAAISDYFNGTPPLQNQPPTSYVAQVFAYPLGGERSGGQRPGSHVQRGQPGRLQPEPAPGQLPARGQHHR